MKPNDKAIEALCKIIEDRLPEEVASGLSEFTRNVFVIDMAVDGLTAAYAAQFKSGDYAGLVKELRDASHCHQCVASGEKAADAIEALLAERDKLKATSDAHVKGWMHQCDKATAAIKERDALAKERDTLLARLAPVEAIENDKDDPTREYIPLPGGWEIQTKGKGSSYRLLDKKTGERHMILAGDAQFVHDFVTRMAKEINASSQVRPVAPVDDKALVEIAATAYLETHSDKITPVRIEAVSPYIRAAIAAIRPHIEAAERERCAKIAEGSFLFDIETWLNSTKKEMTAHVAKAIAAAIRSGR